MKHKKNIVVKLQKEGIHKYPRALTDPSLSEVSFLGHPHRHIFYYKVKISVTHNDRDLEFILVKRYIENLLSNVLDCDFKSCEMLAEDLYKELKNKYGDSRSYYISVYEDNENGAELEWVLDNE